METRAQRPMRDSLAGFLIWGIPLKAMTIPEGSQSELREETAQASERSDPGASMLPGLIGIVKQNLSGAKRRKDGRGEDGVWGTKRYSSPLPHLSARRSRSANALQSGG